MSANLPPFRQPQKCCLSFLMEQSWMSDGQFRDTTDYSATSLVSLSWLTAYIVIQAMQIRERTQIRVRMQAETSRDQGGLAFYLEIV